jgi:hypothetical protein
MAALRFGRWQQEGGTVLARIFVAALFTLIPSIAFGQCSGNFPANTLCGTATGGVPHAVAAPLSVSNTDSSLTIAPTTGSVIASLNPGHSNSWSATQTFSNVIDTNLVSGGTQCVQATAAGLLVGTGAVCGSGGGGGGVTSVNNSDGTLAVTAPTGPAVTVSLALSHANTWTATQTFPNASIAAAELASGAAASNVGTLGGALSGTLPNPTLVVGATMLAGPPLNINLANANTWTATQSINAASPSLVGVRSGKWYANDSPPANELRWKDKLFGGDAAANYPNHSGPFIGNTCATGDWFSNFFSTTQQGSCSYLGIFQMVVLSDASNPNATGGVLGAAQSKNNPGGTQGTQGVMGLALNNGASATFASYAGYFECDQVVNNGTQCVAAEYDVGNTISDAYAGSPDPFTQSALVGVHSACGSGFGAFPTVFKCGSAYQIVNNGNQWLVGIDALNNSIASQTLLGGTGTVVMAMPATANNYGFVWYTGAGAANAIAAIYVDAAGNVQILGTSLKFNGTTITVP